MKLLKIFFGVSTLLTLVACHNDNKSNVVAQKFTHKYGFDLTEEEWNTRTKEGTKIQTLDDGVTITESYNNGILHGNTTFSFPNSQIIQKIQQFENGILIKEAINDLQGCPYKEEQYEPNNKKIVTFWDALGVPISVEEYQNNFLVTGKYYKPDNSLEATIDNSTGTRIKRDRNGELLYKDQIENGLLVFRTNFHSNGKIKSKMGFYNYLLHGSQTNYTHTGDVLMTMNWNMGNLDGMHTTYKNGVIIAEIPYLNGLKHGIERHYNTDKELISEIHWEKDKKHGSERIYDDVNTQVKWFFKGKEVSLKNFEDFSYREKLIADKNHFYEMIDKLEVTQAMKE